MRHNPRDPGDKRAAHYRNFLERVLHDVLKPAILEAGFNTRTNLIDMFVFPGGTGKRPDAMFLPQDGGTGIVTDVTAWEVFRDGRAASVLS